MYAVHTVNTCRIIQVQRVVETPIQYGGKHQRIIERIDEIALQSGLDALLQPVGGARVGQHGADIQNIILPFNGLILALLRRRLGSWKWRLCWHLQLQGRQRFDILDRTRHRAFD